MKEHPDGPQWAGRPRSVIMRQRFPGEKRRTRNPAGGHREGEAAWGWLTSGPSPPSLGSGSRSSLMCLRERKRRCAASWLICLMLLSDSEDTSLGARGGCKGDRRADIDPWHSGNSPALTKGLTPTDMSGLSCSTWTTSWLWSGRILSTELG